MKLFKRTFVFVIVMGLVSTGLLQGCSNNAGGAQLQLTPEQRIELAKNAAYAIVDTAALKYCPVCTTDDRAAIHALIDTLVSYYAPGQTVDQAELTKLRGRISDLIVEKLHVTKPLADLVVADVSTLLDARFKKV